MRICLLSFEYPPETGFGGIGTYTWYHARALARLGHEVHVVAGAVGPADMRAEEHDGVRVVRHRAEGTLMHLAEAFDARSMRWTRNRVENAISMYEGLRRLVRRLRPDIVEMPECGAEGLLVNRLLDLPTVVRFHSPAELIGSMYADLEALDLRWCARAERLAIRSAGFLSSCSRYLADEARDRLGVRRQVEVIPNGIDLELFDAQEQGDMRARLGIPPERPMILFAARMEKRKGIHLCAEIASSILQRFDAAFVFAGDDTFGHGQGELLPALARAGVERSAYFPGKLGLADVRSCMRQADVFLFPSLWENHPYSCLEAMASRLAVVSSDCGGMPEMIRDGENGLLARSGDSAAFTRAVERLLRDAELRRGLGAAARATVEESYRDTHTAGLSVDYYRRCLGQDAS